MLSEACAPGTTFRLMLAVDRIPQRTAIALPVDRVLGLRVEEVQPPSIDDHVHLVSHADARARLEGGAERRALARDERHLVEPAACRLLDRLAGRRGCIEREEAEQLGAESLHAVD